MSATIKSTDQLGRLIEINYPPQRIVSLVPSQTELLFDLGLDERIVGLTRFCVHPQDRVKSKVKIGGTKKFDIEKIKSLNPDLIIGNKEENYQEGIEEIQKHFPVWMSDIFTLEDSYKMIESLAEVTGTSVRGKSLIAEIKSGFKNLQSGTNGSGVSCAYFIWRKPYMVAANDTFINHILGTIGLHNVFATQQRYPEIDPQLLQQLRPDFIFLSSEPYSFSEKHFEEFQSFYPNAKVVLVDGEMFSWYGSRLKLAAGYLQQLKSSLAF